MSDQKPELSAEAIFFEGEEIGESTAKEKAFKKRKEREQMLVEYAIEVQGMTDEELVSRWKTLDYQNDDHYGPPEGWSDLMRIVREEAEKRKSSDGTKTLETELEEKRPRGENKIYKDVAKIMRNSENKR